ncbi:MAG TPA: carboxypeptidase-like regulatory domain-containing protein, partial [Chitinophagales bacterium]|nr:carboxypeptidase-like regulatory domain-containing protein [Chitinophagales bacterium]
MRLNLIIFSGFLFLLLTAQSQTIIKGHVESNKKEIIPGVNIILQDSYDGTTTDIDGNFEFTTDETGTFILIASFIGYVEFTDTLDLHGEVIELNI